MYVPVGDFNQTRNLQWLFYKVRRAYTSQEGRDATDYGWIIIKMAELEVDKYALQFRDRGAEVALMNLKMYTSEGDPA